MDKEKVMFNILKELEKGNTPRREDYGMTKEHYGEILESMMDSKLIKGVKVGRGGRGHLVEYVFTSKMKIDDVGFKFLKENKKSNKLYKSLKEIRDWFPGY